MKIGTIVMFFRVIEQIPYGWNLCDGSNGTPDLRNQFLTCAGDSYAVGDSGGTINHTHPFTSSTHTHYPNNSGDVNSAGASNYRMTSFRTGYTPAAGTTDNGNVLPPYHSVVFIQKSRYGTP